MHGFKDLPIVVECVDTEEKIQEILPELDKMVGGGLITLERVRVIMYRPHAKEDEKPDDWSIDANKPTHISDVPT